MRCRANILFYLALVFSLFVFGCYSVKFTTTIQKQNTDLINRNSLLFNIVSIHFYSENESDRSLLFVQGSRELVEGTEVSIPNIRMYRGMAGPPLGMPYTVSAFRRELIGGEELFVPGITVDNMMQIAHERYPRLFSNDPSALPVEVIMIARYIGSNTALSLTEGLLTLGIIAYHYVDYDFNIKISISDRRYRDICKQEIVISRSDAHWGSITPLGLIPVPGKSDIPKKSVVFPVSWVPETKKLTIISAVDAVVQSAIECLKNNPSMSVAAEN